MIDNGIMTTTEFDTLRSDLAGLRADIESRFGSLESRVAALRTDMDIRFARLEAKIDEKPGAATIYQASLAMFAGMFATIAGTVVVLKTTGFIP
jgi:hypothetical protein